jgi:hypothetical protein
MLQHPRRGNERLVSMRPKNTRPSPLPNPDDPATVLIELTQGKVAIIDAEDADRVCAHLWNAYISQTGIWYAKNGSTPRDYLHRFILDAPAGSIVDHRNGDGLDCRKSNMRLADKRINSLNCKRRPHNKSGFRGVYWEKRRGTWRVVAKPFGKQIHVGEFHDVIEAARAYDAYMRSTVGDLTRYNFPQEDEVPA